jgi:cell division protein FtsB
MLDIQQKRKLRSVMYHKVTVSVLFLFVLLSIHSTWSVYKKKRESEEMKSISLANVIELRDRNEALQDKINRLDTPAGVEEEIRSKFSVAKENENMVVIVPDSSSSSTKNKGNESLWAKFKNFIEFW